MFTIQSDEYFMKEALKEAMKAKEMGDIPVGAVVECGGRIIARAHNQTELLTDVTALTQRIISQRVLAKVCALSVRWHLMRKTGAVLKAMSRGSASLSDFVRFISQQLVPIVVETVVVCIIFLTLFRYEFSCVVVVVIISYITFTVKVTNWRNEHRRVQTKCVTHMFWPAHTRVFIARGLTDAHTHAQNPKARRCVSAEGDGCAAKL